MVIGIDFDGTIVEHFYPKIGAPVPGALEWMKKFIEAGGQLVLFTMRDKGALANAVEYCRENGVDFWGVNTNPEQREWTTSPKAYCQLYIDDAAFGCPLLPGANGIRPMVDWGVVGPVVLGILEKHRDA